MHSPLQAVNAPSAQAPGDRHTLYVFVRTDISPAQQMVQAAHAAAEAGRKFYRAEHGVASLIVLAVPSTGHLLAAAERLRAIGLEHTLFVEPDFGMGPSALGTRALTDGERRHLRSWPLWTPPRSSAAPTAHSREAA